MKQNAREKAMNLLLYRPRSEAELRKRLSDAGYAPEETEDALSYVKRFGYVNDRRFAENYARSRQDRAGRRVIRAELRQKGVDDALIDEALEELETPEEDILAALLRKKAGPPHEPDEREMRRLFGFLSRRGFSTSAVMSAIRQYQSEM